MPLDTTIWAKAIEQLPALAISLGAFLYIFIKGMRFFNGLTTLFMRHQEERDHLFAATLKGIGDACHLHADNREKLLTTELQHNRDAMSDFTAAAARHEQTMARIASVLERVS